MQILKHRETEKEKKKEIRYRSGPKHFMYGTLNLVWCLQAFNQLTYVFIL